MAKQKHDYAALKQEFFDSDIGEVREFFMQKYNKDTAKNRQLAVATKWRTKEKQAHKATIIEDAIKISAKKKANELAIPMEDLMRWKKAIIWLLLQQVKKYVDESKNKDWTINEIDINNAEKILKMFKTELWEPSTIWTNYNLNANKIEWLTEEESEALDMLLNTKSQKVKKPKTNND